MSAMMRNGSGYASPVEDAALRNVNQRAVQDADERVNGLIAIVRKLIDYSGFDLLNRIELYDRKTGRRYL